MKGNVVPEQAVALARVEQRQDVGMVQLGGEADLGEEALAAEDGGEFRTQHLERDVPVVPEIVREVHRRHPALPQLALEPVAVRQ